MQCFFSFFLFRAMLSLRCQLENFRLLNLLEFNFESHKTETRHDLLALLLEAQHISSLAEANSSYPHKSNNHHHWILHKPRLFMKRWNIGMNDITPQGTHQKTQHYGCLLPDED
jgi:hypothetical protein